MINHVTFDMIYKIQNQNENVDKQDALEKLEQIDRTLEMRVKDYFHLKERSIKKQLIKDLEDCRHRSKSVLNVLRDCDNLYNIQNHTIAKLNDVAYRAIFKGKKL